MSMKIILNILLIVLRNFINPDYFICNSNYNEIGNQEILIEKVLFSKNNCNKVFLKNLVLSKKSSIVIKLKWGFESFMALFTSFSDIQRSNSYLKYLTLKYLKIYKIYFKKIKAKPK